MGGLEAAALIYSQNSCPHDVFLSKSLINSGFVIQKGCLVAELHLGKVGKVAKNGLEQRCNKHAAAAAHRIRQVDGHHARIMLTRTHNAHSINADVMRE